MRDELRNMLYLYDREDLVQFAKKIFVHATKGGADILNIDAGEIAEGKKADMVVISLKDKFSRIDEAILYYLLYKYPIEKIFIEGKEVA
jgi:5-methylthioadenosine/S-adenosylhomocysteine deaminase